MALYFDGRGLTEKECLDSVGLGWQKLVGEMLLTLAETGDQVAGIKEKFGGLRVYLRQPLEGQTSYLSDLAIQHAKDLAENTCERCGAKRASIVWATPHHWLKTLCIECQDIIRASPHATLWEMIRGPLPSTVE